MPWNGGLSGGTCVGESRPGTSGWQPFETCAADGAWKTKREERQYKLRLKGLDEIWRDFVEYFKLINLQKISSWQQRNHSNRENRPKERNFFRTLSKKGDKMSFFPSLLFWNGNEKSFETNITKLQSVLPRCQTYNIQVLSEIRRQNRCLKTRYLKTNFNVNNGILKHFRLKVKKRLHT